MREILDAPIACLPAASCGLPPRIRAMADYSRQ
jgi:hypothetical protein